MRTVHLLCSVLIAVGKSVWHQEIVQISEMLRFESGQAGHETQRLPLFQFWPPRTLSLNHQTRALHVDKAITFDGALCSIKKRVLQLWMNGSQKYESTSFSTRKKASTRNLIGVVGEFCYDGATKTPDKQLIKLARDRSAWKTIFSDAGSFYLIAFCRDVFVLI